MNPTTSLQPAQLFDPAMHAGGWPKLGFELHDGDDLGWAEEAEMPAWMDALPY